MGLISKS